MSRVVVVRHSGEIPQRMAIKEEYRLLLEAGLKTLAGESEFKPAVAKFLPAKVIGMKASCLARKFNSTPVAIVAALSDILGESGIAENNIVLWERTNQELGWAGFIPNFSSTGRRFIGTDTTGFGYSTDFYSSGPVNSLISRILTELVDYNINLPVLKDHSLAGLSGALKNMYGVINNPNKYHDNNCDPFAAHISNLEPIRRKNRLTIIDAVRVQCSGGPGFDSRYLDYYYGLILSEDPVAADRIGLEILEHYRAIRALPTLEKIGRPVKYLKSAETIGLGIADISKIDLQVLKVSKSGVEKLGGLF